MKFLVKLFLAATAVTSVSVPIAIEASKNSAAKENQNVTREIENPYVVSSNGYTLNVDPETLYFEVSKGDQVWNSGAVNPDDDNLRDARESFIVSPITIGFMTSNGSENYFSMFDRQHRNLTEITFNEEETGFSADIQLLDGNARNRRLDVTLTLHVNIVEDGLNIYVDNIVENTETTNRLSYLNIYPGFEASYGLIDGYALIPDGSGALIDYSVPTNATRLLTLTTYDADSGIRKTSRKSTSSDIYSLPMYGLNNGNKSTLVTLESGAEYSSFNSKSAGITDDYNLNYFTFIFREIYHRFSGISESSFSIVPMENAKEFIPSLTYHLYDEKLSYGSFAQKYRDYLLDNNLLTAAQDLESNLRLEFMMSESKSALFGREVVVMSDVNFVKDVVNELVDTQNMKLDVSMLGYKSGGMTNSYPNNFPVEGRTGGENGYRDLGSYLEGKNIDYTFSADYVRSFEESGISNYDLAMNMSEKYIEISDYHPGNELVFNLLTLNKTRDLINDDVDYIKGINGKGVDFLSIGNSLYSSNYNQVFTRTDAVKFYQDTLNNLDYEVNLRKPNLYLYNNFTNYLEAPTSNSGFLMETESIPFLSMVLSGYKNLYSSALNLNYLGQSQILGLIDYNINPTYLVTEESAINLFQTSSEYIFSSMYSDWKEEIINTYQMVNSVLREVSGAEFLSRTKIEGHNAYANTYNNNKTIVVNYENSPVSYEGHEVAALSSEVF